MAGVLETIVPQLRPEDELIVVPDGVKLDIQGSPNIHVVCLPFSTRDYGCTPKDVGMLLARGDYLWFIDDDDEFAPDAVTVIHKGMEQNPGKLLIFDMYHGGLRKRLGGVIHHCAVGAPQAVAPRMVDPPLWRDHQGFDMAPDYAWIKRVAEKHEPVFIRSQIATVPQQNYGKFV